MLETEPLELRTADEDARLAVLDRYEILDSPPEEDFDDLVELAAELCDAPVCLVSLVDRERLFLKARYGTDQTEMRRADADFCGRCIEGDDLLVVPDAHKHPLFSSFPAVRTGQIRFYAGAPLRVEGGHAIGTLCVIDQVPRELEAKQRAVLGTLARQVVAQLELKRTLERQRRLDQLKNDFVGMVAHDLRSPITVIAGFAELLSGHGRALSEEERVKYLDLIAGNVQSLSRLVDDVLKVAEVDSSEFQLEIQPFDLAKLIEKTVVEVSASDVALRTDVPEDLPLALGDEGRCRQVLGNLVSNAVKFSPEHAPVTVSVTSRERELEVAVRDEGPGIAASEVPRLFERFSRLQNAASAKAKGTGLGLYICRQLVEAQGGRIWVDSTLGAGSTFRYTVPRA
jgi:signal transduction histidine kinase